MGDGCPQSRIILRKEVRVRKVGSAAALRHLRFAPDLLERIVSGCSANGRFGENAMKVSNGVKQSFVGALA
jgi:hypothetical protein